MFQLRQDKLVITTADVCAVCKEAKQTIQSMVKTIQDSKRKTAAVKIQLKKGM